MDHPAQWQTNEQHYLYLQKIYRNFQQNNDENTDSVVTIIITDTNSNEFIYERNRDVPRGSTIEILQPSNDSFDSSLLILNSSEVLKAVADGSELHLVASVLEMT